MVQYGNVSVGAGPLIIWGEVAPQEGQKGTGSGVANVTVWWGTAAEILPVLRAGPHGGSFGEPFDSLP